MTIQEKTELVVTRRFDPDACRHFLNDSVYVLHCHHYASLYTQLADDAEIFDGRALLRKAAELAFLPELRRAFEQQGVEDVAGRLALVEQYWRLVGMGLLVFEKAGPMAATACMKRSHVDEGWIKKWGKRDKPVNFIGQGFLAAAMSAVYDLPAGSFQANEIVSIVCGAESSRFNIART